MEPVARDTELWSAENYGGSWSFLPAKPIPDPVEEIN